MVHKDTHKPVSPDGKNIPPVQAQLHCLVTQQLPLGQSELPDLTDFNVDVSALINWPILYKLSYAI